MPKCCVRGCGSNYSKKAPLISLHKLPKNDKLKSKWLESLGQENIDSSQENVCSLHFEESCINRSLDIVRLHDNAIPTRLPKAQEDLLLSLNNHLKMKRGALIVIEGVDRTGKSTQARTLVENLKKKNIQAEYTNFPARETDVGKIINGYLQLKNDLSDEVIHLLFSANRWERAKNIIKTLEAGTTLIVDRYCYSGVAFSAAKGLDLNWCKSPDVGLPKPDKVFFLTMPVDSITQRNGFGMERYEVLNFQKKVSETYSKLKEDNWEMLDANRSIDSIQEDLLERTLNVVNDVTDKNIGKLWTK